ncbi:MAG: PP2C family protein-serine/threonine phosphatase [Planctomycetota bacterium]|nr:PP2C family protein-serine/threonine phosphatase [Planctomycetota bacterium]
MIRVNLEESTRLGVLSEALEIASRARAPTDVFLAFGPRLYKIRPIDFMLSLSTRNLPAGHFKITRRFDVAAVARGEAEVKPVNTWAAFASLPLLTGGFVSDVIATPTPKLFHHLYLKNDPILGDEFAAFGSCIAIPLWDDGKVQNWTLQFRSEPEAYTVAQLEDNLFTGNLIGSMTRTLVAVNEARRLNEALTAQFEQVARVQQALLPDKTPEIPGLRIATSYLTSDQAGGDYFDFFELPDRKWGVVIADAAGHGAAAATVMAMLRAILHCYAPSCQQREATAVGALSFANSKLCKSRLDGNFVTAFLGVYDPKTHEFEFANAGHNPPRVRRADGTIEPVLYDGAGLPLGIMEPYECTSSRLTLRPGDTLVLYTDGITEAFNAQREMFGEQRLDAALRSCSGEADCIIDSIHKALFEHNASRTRSDDQTLVVLERVADSGERE